MVRAWLRRPAVWIVLFVLLAGAAVAVLRLRGPRVATTRVRRADLEQHVIASGRVWVPTRVQVSAQAPGLVVAVGAAEGERVKKGDVLLQLDDAEARAAVSQAQASVDQARAKMEQLRRVGAIVASESLREAESNLERTRSDLERVQKLAASGAVAAIELENARRAFDVARAQRNAAEATQLSSTPTGADTRVAVGALLQAEAQLAGAKVRLAQTRVVALDDGVVLSRSVEPGDVVQPGRTLLVFAVDARAQLVIEPDERNLAWIALGQKARASADAYPQEPFDAEVTFIAPAVDPQRGSVEVRLAIPAPPKFLKPDMTISVDLTVASRKGALTVPTTALRGAAGAMPWLLSVDDGRLARRDVRLGIRGDGVTEIASGVAEGAEIVTEQKVLTPGMRVRTAEE